MLIKSGADGKPMELLSEMPVSDALKPVKLRIVAEGATYSFYYSKGASWELVKEKVDAKFLSTEVAGGFIGCLFGMYATSSGDQTNNAASFKYLRYSGNDTIFKTIK